ncbi:PAS domain-containing protein [Aquimarina sp. ERC-38]|uniref:PAS domain-containing protein n=1 Tax=Aquimarina sp. ERC-38 TaxID=2949996 RepID=UPI0022469C72|nr:PAS domain-containing protein [Aquimarina sp. ERC-38]UZO80427.1 PAS domain-containing protein [Aquimarina sp. ERC-38]
MKEFRVYDNVMANYYKSSFNSILPLNSWEFYSEYFESVINFKNDIDQLNKISVKWNFNEDYVKEMVVNHKVVVVTTPTLEIVYASHNIKRMNGYIPQEVIGKSPKMFQGRDTCKLTTTKVGKAVKEALPFEVSVLNYRKDNSTYICKIQGFPVFSTNGKLVNYIAFEEAA